MGEAFEFSIDETVEKFSVVEFSGKERLNDPYRFDVKLIGRAISARTAEVELLGQSAHLRLAQSGGETDRWVHGVIVLFEREGVSGHDPDKHHYRARLAPAFRLLGEGRRSRIFQDKSVPEIVSELLGAGGVRHAMRFSASYRSRSYCVQYRESDQRFIERLLREEGIFYWFEQPNGEDEAEIMVLADAPSASPAVDGPEKLRFSDSSGMADRTEDVRQFRIVQRIEPTRVALRDFDFMRPSFAVSAEATRDENGSAREGFVTAPGAADGPAMFVGGPPTVEPPPDRQSVLAAARRRRRAAMDRARTSLSGTSSSEERARLSEADGALEMREIREPVDVPRPDEIERYDHHGELEGGRVDASLAQTHLEQYRRRAMLGLGESRDVHLLPGRRFTIVACPIESDDGEYVVIEVEHQGRNPTSIRAEAGQRANEIYRNSFVCVPSTVPFRPKRPKRRIQQVMETATVVGPTGSEIHTDSLGRVKVHFHWDRGSAQNPDASCWLRVAGPWAGTGFGFQFIPRVGMEVVVGFLSGDVDRPVVLGSVYNAEHPVPFGLPGEKTKSGIRTHSTRGGGGYNELSFEDRKNYERVHLRAQKDLDVLVQNNEVRRVEQHQTTQVGANQYTMIGGNRIGMVSGDANDRVGQSSREQVGTEREAIIGTSDTLRVGLNRVEHVGLDAIRHIRNRATDDIGSDALVQVGNGYTLRAGAHLTMIVGGAEHPGATALHTFGPKQISSTGFLDLESERGIVLRCGTSMISLLPDRVDIQAENVSVVASDARLVLGGGDARIIAAGSATVQSNEVKVAGQAASVELTAEATIKGAKVKLGGSASSSDNAPSQQSQPTKIALVDREENALPHQRYVIKLPDGTERVGVLDDQGKAELDIDAGGQAEIRFPEAVGAGGSSIESTKPHVVRPGDYLTELAFRRGFDAEAVWSHDDNRELRERRANPEMLLPGDILHVPDHPPRPETLRLKSENRFVVNVPMAEATVRLVDDAGRALAGEAYRIEGAPGEPISGSADGDGNVRIRVPVTVRSVRLVLPGKRAVMNVMMGHLDPIEHDSGVRQRLESLGYVGSRPGAGEIANAIRRFQHNEGLSATGEMNDETRARLRDRHGS